MTAYAVQYDPLREIRHKHARAARDVADWLTWLEVSNKAARTVDGYARTAERLLQTFPHKTFDEFTDGDLMHVLALIPPRSRNQHKSHLSSLFTWGYKTSRRIRENPVDRLPEIRYTPDRVYDIFTEAEADALCGLPMPDGPLMELLLWGGLRRGEARHLTVKRIDFDRRQILVIDGAKRSKSRVVPLLPRVETAVSELILLEGLGRDDYLWYDRISNGASSRTRRSHPIADSTFGTRWWPNCLADARVRYRRPHLTRHTYATMLRARGVLIEDLQSFLGHASVQTTLDTYVHSNADERADRLRAIFEDVEK